MQTLKCNDCGWVFDDEDEYARRTTKESHGEYYSISVCPMCGSEDVDEYDEPL